MVGMRLRWDTSGTAARSTTALITTPVAQYISGQRSAGVPSQIIIERLLEQGVPYKDIRSTFRRLTKKSRKSRLDWRNPTAVNDTARLIRKDIRKGKISYPLGMTVLLRAKRMLGTVINNPRVDKRLQQINQEILTTKRLLMTRFGNTDMVRNYHVC